MVAVGRGNDLFQIRPAAMMADVHIRNVHHKEIPLQPGQLDLRLDDGKRIGSQGAHNRQRQGDDQRRRATPFFQSLPFPLSRMENQQQTIVTKAVGNTNLAAVK